jgi:hypothetical protein
LPHGSSHVWSADVTGDLSIRGHVPVLDRHESIVDVSLKVRERVGEVERKVEGPT